MTQPLLHVLEREAHAQQIARRAVTKFMEADMGHAVLLEELSEFSRHIVGSEGFSVLPAEHIIIIAVGIAVELLILLLLCFQAQEQLLDLCGHRKGSTAGDILGLVLGDDLGDFRDRSADGESLILKVHAVPAQTECFASAQSVERGDADHRIERFVMLFRFGEKLLYLRHRVEARFMAFLRWKSQEPARILVDDALCFVIGQRHVDDRLDLSERDAGETARAVQLSFGRFLVDEGLQILLIDVAQAIAFLGEVRKDLHAHHDLIALLCDRVDGTFDVSGLVGVPLFDRVGEGHERGAVLQLLPMLLFFFILLEGFAQELLRLCFIALDGQVGVDPLDLAFAVPIGIQNEIIFVVFDLQASCHYYSFLSESPPFQQQYTMKQRAYPA